VKQLFKLKLEEWEDEDWDEEDEDWDEEDEDWEDEDW